MSHSLWINSQMMQRWLCLPQVVYVPLCGISSWSWSSQRPRPWSPPSCRFSPGLTPSCGQERVRGEIIRHECVSNQKQKVREPRQTCGHCAGIAVLERRTWNATSLYGRTKYWKDLELKMKEMLTGRMHFLKNKLTNCKDKQVNKNITETAVLGFRGFCFMCFCLHCTFSISWLLFSLISMLTGVSGNFLNTSSSRANFLSAPLL